MATCATCGTELSFLSNFTHNGQRICGACHDALSGGGGPRRADRATAPAAGVEPARPAAGDGRQVRLTTTTGFGDHAVEAWLDVVHASVVIGLDARKELLAAVRNLPGARADRLGAEIAAGMAEANQALRQAAARLGADAVIGARFDARLEPLGGSQVNERMLVVQASGTAVRLARGG